MERKLIYDIYAFDKCIVYIRTNGEVDVKTLPTSMRCCIYAKWLLFCMYIEKEKSESLKSVSLNATGQMAQRFEQLQTVQTPTHQFRNSK